MHETDRRQLEIRLDNLMALTGLTSRVDAARELLEWADRYPKKLIDAARQYIQEYDNAPVG